MSGRADVSSVLRDIYQAVIPIGEKEGGSKKKLADWVTRGFVYIFVLVGCQPLHAWFPTGLPTAYCNMIRKSTEEQTRCGNLPAKTIQEPDREVALCLPHHRSPHGLDTSVPSSV